MNVPRACSAMRCSGDPAAPTATSGQPRLAASVATASVSGVVPEADTAMTRSAAPDQPGSRLEPTVVTCSGLPGPQIAPRMPPATPEPPIPATTIARGLACGVNEDRSVSAQDPS